MVRFVEKPSWGQVVTDLVNTGIYLLSPGAGADPPDRPWDFGKDVFPALLESGGGLYGVPGGGYWCDMGTAGPIWTVRRTPLWEGEAGYGPASAVPGVWSAQPIPEGVTVIPALLAGPGAAVEPGALIGPHTVLEQNSWVGRRSLVQRSVLLPGARAEERTTLYGAILCKGAAARPGGRPQRGDRPWREGLGGGEGRTAGGGAPLASPGCPCWDAAVPLHHFLRPPGASSVRGRRGDPGAYWGEDLGPEALMTIGGVLGCEGKVGLGYWGGTVPACWPKRPPAASPRPAGPLWPMTWSAPPRPPGWRSTIRSLSLFFGAGGGPHLSPSLRPQRPASGPGQGAEAGTRRSPGGRPGSPPVRLARWRVHAGCDDYAADAARRSRLHRFPMRSITVAVPGSAPADRAIRQALSSLGCTVLDRWRKGVPAFWAPRRALPLRSGRVWHPSGPRAAAHPGLPDRDGGRRGRVAVPDGASAAVDLVAAGFHGTALRLGRDGEQALSLYAAALPWLRDAALLLPASVPGWAPPVRSWRP